MAATRTPAKLEALVIQLQGEIIAFASCCCQRAHGCPAATITTFPTTSVVVFADMPQTLGTGYLQRALCIMQGI